MGVTEEDVEGRRLNIDPLLLTPKGVAEWRSASWGFPDSSREP